jgi:hypothetical protein
MNINSNTGEITLSFGEEAHTIRFGLKFLSAITKAGEGPSDALSGLATQPLDALIDLLTKAIVLSVPADKLPSGFDVEATMELVDKLPDNEQEAIWDTLLNATRRNPIMRSLSKLTAAQ